MGGTLIEERVQFAFFIFLVSACVCVFRIFLWLYGRLQNLIAPCRLANAGGGFPGKWRGFSCIALLWGILEERLSS